MGIIDWLSPGIARIQAKLRVRDGLTIEHGQSVFNDQLTVESGGVVINDGLTVESGVSVFSDEVRVASTTDSLVGTRYTADGLGPFIFLQKSRNATVGSHTIVQNGDALGGILFLGSDGDSFVRAAQIGAYVSSTPGSDDMPTKLYFATTPDGGSSEIERMSIYHSGAIVINETGADADFRVEGDTDSNLFVIDAGTDSVSIGNGGAGIKKILSATKTWDPPSTSTLGTTTTLTVTGATVGDPAFASFDQITSGTWFISANVTASDTVTVAILVTSGATDLGSGTLRAVVFKF